ncbi:radical SAM protein [Bacteroides pyogenes]|uniref:B12-binding domain-containing radical SAM protein n=1 Tax=Bacteroides pyogenes TaxID=310300 RepID=UPI002A7EA969|nr:radical SAM protein [Bacteroides pyogenes]MDY4250770.1 radical SAM protein [Bacteroides pyogenes]
MDILLNWFPPAFVKIPSPAMSVLKGYLNQFGYHADVCYWNLILRDMIHSLAEQGKDLEINEFESLMPFLAILLNASEDKEKLKRLYAYYQALHPQYFSIDKQKYYEESLNEYAEQILLSFNEKLIDMYSRKNYTLIGVCTKLLQLVPANIFAKISKTIAPNRPIVAGGISNKIEAVAMLHNFKEYDYAIWGEGEIPLHQLCRFLNNEISIEEIPNVAYRNDDGETLISKCNNRLFSNLNNTKPDFSDYFNCCKRYNIHDIKTMVPLESSRGCHWNKCKFCFLTEGYRNRAKENQSIIAEILDTIEKYGIYEFVFLDNDVIFNDFDKFEDLLDRLIQIKDKYEDFGIWNGEVVTKGLNADIIKRMTLAGFKSIQIGYEAVSDSLLRKICKKNTFSSNLMFVKWAKEYDLNLQGLNVITGLIGEEDSDIISSTRNLHYLRFFLKKEITKHDIIPLQIMKSSRYFKVLKERGDLNLWNDNLLYDLFPQNYIHDDNKYELMFFSSMISNPLWDNFRRVNDYYETTNFNYKLYYGGKETILYVELIDKKIVSKLEFDIKNEFHWKILKFCNKRVRSLDEIIQFLNISGNKEKQVLATNALADLNAEYILYSNAEYTENIAIINTDFIY